MRKKWSRSTERVVDRIWPRILGPRESCPEEREFTLEGSEEILLKAEEYAHALAEKAEERETAIDRKLFSLFSISTVASSVMIALLIGAATITVPDATAEPPYLVILAIGLVAYIALQMLNTVRNTVKGLEELGRQPARTLHHPLHGDLRRRSGSRPSRSAVAAASCPMITCCRRCGAPDTPGIRGRCGPW